MIREEQLYNEVKENGNLIASNKTKKLIKHFIRVINENNNIEYKESNEIEILKLVEQHQITLEDHNKFLQMVDEASDIILDMVKYLNEALSDIEKEEFINKVNNRHSYFNKILDDKRTYTLVYIYVESEIRQFINMLQSDENNKIEINFDKAQLHTVIETILAYTELGTYLYDITLNKVEEYKIRLRKRYLTTKIEELNEISIIMDMEQNDDIIYIEEEINALEEELEKLY